MVLLGLKHFQVGLEVFLRLFVELLEFLLKLEPVSLLFDLGLSLFPFREEPLKLSQRIIPVRLDSAFFLRFSHPEPMLLLHLECLACLTQLRHVESLLRLSAQLFCN